MEHRSFPRSSALLRASLVTGLTSLIVACSGGGGGGSGLAPGAGFQLTGVWNFEREWLACNGAYRFETNPLEIADTGNGVDHLVRLGGFEFAAVLADDTLTLSGSSTVGSETLTIVDAALTIEPDGQTVSGTLEIDSVTVDVFTVQCFQTHEVRAFRPDATDQSELLGEWEWTMAVAAREGAWDGDPVGATTRVPVTITPQREGRLTADLTTPDGNRLQLDLQEESDSIVLLPSTQLDEFFPPVEFEVVVDAFRLDRAARFAVGSLGLMESPTDGSAGSTTTYAVDMRRAPVGTAYMPYVSDVLGAADLRLVDPILVSSVDLGIDVENVGSASTLQDPSKVLGTNTALQYRGTFDPVAEEVTDLRAHTLYFRDTGGIWALDLAKRVDENGVERASVPEFVIETELAEDAELRCYPVIRGPRGVLTYRTPQGLMMTELEWDGTQRTTALPADVGTIHFETFDRENGVFEGLIVQRHEQQVGFDNHAIAGQVPFWPLGELLRVRADGTMQSLGQAIQPEVFRGTDGRVWFGPGERTSDTHSAPIYQFDPTTKEVYVVDSSYAGFSRKFIGVWRNNLWVAWRTDTLGDNGSVRLRMHWPGFGVSQPFSNLMAQFDDVRPEAGLNSVRAVLGRSRGVVSYVRNASPQIALYRSFDMNALVGANDIVPLTISEQVLSIFDKSGSARYAGVFGEFLLQSHNFFGKSFAIDLDTGLEYQMSSTDWRLDRGAVSDVHRFDGTAQEFRSMLLSSRDELWALPDTGAFLPDFFDPYDGLIRLDVGAGDYEAGWSWANSGPHLLVGRGGGSLGPAFLELMHDRQADSATVVDVGAAGAIVMPVK
jgi:hypothetical protein